MSEAIQVMTTVDSEDTAQEIADKLIGKHLAACVQVLGPIRSRYWWQGEVADDREWLLLIKSRREIYQQLEQAIQEQHPYSVPEILAVPVVAGHRAYLDWLNQETGERRD